MTTILRTDNYTRIRMATRSTIENEAFVDAADDNGGNVSRVTVKLPPFWPEEPDIWFAQADAQFRVSGIKDEATKFYYVIAQLEHRYAREVKDLITSPPKDNMYEKLKQELIKRLSVSREQRMRQLLTHEELGDRKPSQFLRHLRTLAAGGVTDDFLRSIWSSRLPSSVQQIIASQSSVRLDELAELADKICEVALPTCQVASTSKSTGNFDDLIKRIDEVVTSRVQAELSKQISQLNLHGRNRSRQRSHSHKRSGSRGQSKGRQGDWKDSGMCWYHYNYGQKARSCQQPCNFKISENTNGSQ